MEFQNRIPTRPVDNFQRSTLHNTVLEIVSVETEIVERNGISKRDIMLKTTNTSALLFTIAMVTAILVGSIGVIEVMLRSNCRGGGAGGVGDGRGELASASQNV